MFGRVAPWKPSYLWAVWWVPGDGEVHRVSLVGYHKSAVIIRQDAPGWQAEAWAYAGPEHGWRLCRKLTFADPASLQSTTLEWLMNQAMVTAFVN